MALLQFGRYMRVLYTPPSGSPALEICKYDSQSDAPSLRVDVQIVRHLRPAGQPSTVVIYNLNPATRTAIGTAAKLAREQSYATRTAVQAGRIEVWIGRSAKDAALFASDAILDVKSEYRAPTWRTEITGMDGRLPWEGFFMNTSEVRPPIAPWIAAQLGIPSPPQPDKRKRRSVTYSVLGAGRDEALAIFAQMGLAPIFNGDAPRFLPTNGAILLPALDLTPIVTDPGEPGAWGVRQVGTMLDPGLVVGRQVLFHGLHRIEEIAADASTRDAWTAKLGLRPV